MPVRGIRGAVKIEKNTREAVFRSTQKLLKEMQRANGVKIEDIVSVFLTMTPDLNADYPAYAAREMGWTQVPLLGATEIAVPHGMKKVIRALMHVNTSKKQKQIKHQYLGETAKLRPDLAQSTQRRGNKTRLAQACSKLTDEDRAFQTTLAEEGLAVDVKTWPKY